MDTPTQEIQKHIDQLVPAVKQAVLSPEWRKRVGEIGTKYSLHLDQISSLEYEVLFVMIGMEPEGDLVNNIQTELPVSKILAEQLAEDINVRIFQYIMKSLEEKVPEKAKRFTDSSNEVRDMNYEKKDGKVKTETSPLATPISAPVPSTPPINPIKPIIMGEDGTIQSPTSNLIHQTSILPQSHQKIAEPPMNLPSEDGGMSNEVRDMSDTRNELGDISKSAPIVSPNSYVVTPSTPAPSLAETKLNTIVTSPTEVQKPEATPIVKSYSVDPYREPIE